MDTLCEIDGCSNKSQFKIGLAHQGDEQAKNSNSRILMVCRNHSRWAVSEFLREYSADNLWPVVWYQGKLLFHGYLDAELYKKFVTAAWDDILDNIA